MATFFLLIVGGLVHGTGASLACPDWPTCHGTLMPEMTGLVFYEHGHRLVASAVGLMTLVLAGLIWTGFRENPALRWLGVTAAVLVILQGLLGAATVIWRLPPAVSTAHLGTAMVYFGLLVVIAFLTRPGRPVAGVPEGELHPFPAIRRWTAVSTAVVYVQIVLGAVVRHTNAGLACTGFPLCGETAWPAGAVWVHMGHRIGALLVIAAVVMLVLVIRREAPLHRAFRTLRVALLVMLAVQAGLGIASVFTRLELVTVTAHLAGGAALLALHVAAWMVSREANRFGTPLAAETVTGGARPSEAI
ncbi:MAG: heme A synthase [Deltaproteobacteria bacterium]|nr:heme A synthase [Deltaproteobacteria bacterium]